MKSEYQEQILNILQDYKSNNLNVDQAQDAIKRLLDVNIEDYANLDYHRQERTGIPEVIYAEGKTAGQVAGIFTKLAAINSAVIATRVPAAMYAEIQHLLGNAEYNTETRLLIQRPPAMPEMHPGIAVITAGTSDIPVAEEAAITAELMGNSVERIFDVGVAGVHRLFHRLNDLRKANVIVVTAGMEGALPSVVGGLVSAPIIALPTSIGYGASFGGVAALLGMLNSCSPGIAAVNIDNGFGAGCMAAKINALRWQQDNAES